MQIKRFEAKNMTTALRMIKDELGPDAVILSARSIKKGRGIFASTKNTGVEVTAAIDANLPKVQKSAYAGATGAYNRSGSIAPQDALQKKKRSLMQTFNGGIKNLAGKRVSSPDGNSKYEDNSGQSSWISALYQHMLSQDIKREYASEIAEDLSRIPGSDQFGGRGESIVRLADILEDIGLSVEPIGTNPSKQEIHVFVGPTGIGKTTTIAKFAAHCKIRKNQKVAILTLDNIQVGANEKLKMYAGIIGCPLEMPNSPAEFKNQIKKFKGYDIILVDTPGINFRDKNQNEEMRCYLEKIKSKRIHLVVGANTREKELRNTVNELKNMPVTNVVFTKLDECDTLGTIINFLIQTRIPLSLLSNGQQIPEDIVTASVETLIEIILQPSFAVSKRQRSTTPHIDNTARLSRQDYYVANINSDVYHTPGCKWTDRIKPENMVEFENVEEAESKRFLPCRNCNPNRYEHINSTAHSRDKVSISSYR